MTARAPAVLGVALSAVLLGCTPSVARAEVARLPSPDGALDAVVVVTDGGATTPQGFFVHLLAHGAPPEADDLAVRVVGPCCAADGRSGLDVRWTGPRELAVRYREARFADPPGPEIAAAAPLDDGTAVPVTVRIAGG